MFNTTTNNDHASNTPPHLGLSRQGSSSTCPNDLVLEFLPKIQHIARTMVKRLPSHVPYEDLLSAGAYGLVDASRKYVPQKCRRFEVYAEHRIRGAMLDELRSYDSLSRDLRTRTRKRNEVVTKLEKKNFRAPTTGEIIKELGIKMRDYNRFEERVYRGTTLNAEAITRDGIGAQAFEDTSIPDPHCVAKAQEVKKLLKFALNRLPDRLKLVANLYYYEGYKLSEIGSLLGVTEARACQLRGEAIQELKQILLSCGISFDQL